MDSPEVGRGRPWTGRDVRPHFMWGNWAPDFCTGKALCVQRFSFGTKFLNSVHQHPACTKATTRIPLQGVAKTNAVSWAICMVSTEREIAKARQVLLEAHRQYLHYVLHGGPPKGARLDFSGEDLRHAEFSDADLSHATLNRVRFRNAELQSSDFHLADLEGARFGRARLRGAKLPRRQQTSDSDPRLG